MLFIRSLHRNRSFDHLRQMITLYWTSADQLRLVKIKVWGFDCICSNIKATTTTAAVATYVQLIGRTSEQSPHHTRPLCLRRSSVIVTQFDTHCGAKTLALGLAPSLSLSLSLLGPSAQWVKLALVQTKVGNLKL